VLHIRISAANAKVYLRTLEYGDAAAIAANANDKEIAESISDEGTFPHPYSEEDALSFIKRASEEASSGIGLHMGICSAETGEIVGAIGLSYINMRSKKSEVGFWIGRRFWGKGYGKDALRLMLAFGFARLGLNRIYGIAFASNERSIRMMKSVGMKEEARLKEDGIKNGSLVDNVQLAILSREFALQDLSIS